ncbi:uncharacterized protein LOC134274173 [Saccostrea cucullata]|uniref:uncharacterized protein LOC134274173 n=1 Tax=Saccostrea cuccullata TaxID=36930 RepID=UPI002ED5A878
MPVLKRRSGSIGQRKKYHSKRQRSHSVSDVSVQQHDHSYNTLNSSSAPGQDFPDISQCSSPDIPNVMEQENVQLPSDQSYCSSQVTADQEREAVEDVQVTSPVSQTLPHSTVESEDPLTLLKDELISLVCSPYTVTYHLHQHAIEIIEFYKHQEQTSSVKLSVVIGRDFYVNIYVHRTLIPYSHDFWSGLPRQTFTAAGVCRVLDKLKHYGVCVGNPNAEFQDLTPAGSGLSDTTSEEISAFREGNLVPSREICHIVQRYDHRNVIFLLKAQGV